MHIFSSTSSLVRNLLGDASEELGLLLLGLEASVSHLGRGIDELQVDLLERGTLDLREQSLTQGDDALLGSHDAALDHEPVLVDLTVVRESTERGDVLLGNIHGSLSVVLVLLKTDLVDLLVDLDTVVVTVLTSARDLELNAGRMPRTDTGDLAETTMGLTRKTGDSPTGDNTVDTATLGNSDDIDHLVDGEDVLDADLLLEEGGTEVDLLGDVASFRGGVGQSFRCRKSLPTYRNCYSMTHS